MVLSVSELAALCCGRDSFLCTVSWLNQRKLLKPESWHPSCGRKNELSLQRSTLHSFWTKLLVQINLSIAHLRARLLRKEKGSADPAPCSPFAVKAGKHNPSLEKQVNLQDRDTQAMGSAEKCGDGHRCSHFPTTKCTAGGVGPGELASLMCWVLCLFFFF